MKEKFVSDIANAARKNDNYRNVIFTGPKSQLVLMSLLPGEEIGAEVHDGDQILYIVDGEGRAVLDGVDEEIEKGSLVFVPTGVRHNVVCDKGEPLKLFTLYAPPQHAAGTVERTKPKERGQEVG
jgi:mannose-6-phosphate isomerase-like protein (cupin superfamily)